MIPVTHVFEWANIADKVRRNLFMEFAEVGAKHLVLTCEMILNCMAKTGASNDDTLMIGDGFNDQKAAEKAKVGFIAAAYGYGITVDNCREYGYEYASEPEGLRKAIEAHWKQ